MSIEDLSITASLPGPWIDLAQLFIRHHAQNSPGTGRVYRGVLAAWFSFAKEPTKPNPAELLAFIIRPRGRGGPAGTATKANRRIVLSSFYRFAMRAGLLHHSPVDRLERIRRPDPRPRALELEDMTALLRNTPPTADGYELRAFIVVGLLTGLRRQAIVELTRNRLAQRSSWANGTPFYESRIKGGRTIRAELPLPALEAVTQALRARGLHLEFLRPDDRIFRYGIDWYYRHLVKLGRRLGIAVTPHQLRHTAARLRRTIGGATVEDVQRLLHHRSPTTTERYLTELEDGRDPGWRPVAAALGLDRKTVSR